MSNTEQHSSSTSGPQPTLDPSAINEQLEKLLASRHFALSKRYPALLRHLVSKALAGEESLLKERLIGIDVFGRSPDYNTADDPIVRITIAEVRKRIAQYYHETEHLSELRIEILSGSYVPVFSMPYAHPPEPLPGPEVVPAEPLPPVDPPVAPKPSFGRLLLRHRFLYSFSFLLLLALGGVAIYLQHLRQTNPIDVIWQPFLDSHAPLVLCIGRPGNTGTDDMTTHDTDSTTLKEHINQVNAVTYDDINAMLKVVQIFNSRHREFTLKSSSRSTFADLQQGPTILLGALDNRWFVHAMNSLPYQMVGTGQPGMVEIVDARKPVRSSSWLVDQNEPYKRITYDYAIAARFLDRETDQQTMMVGGIGGDGTEAAAEFLRNPEENAPLLDLLRNNPSKHNFEVVLGTQLVDGIPGPARILATEIW